MSKGPKHYQASRYSWELLNHNWMGLRLSPSPVASLGVKHSETGKERGKGVDTEVAGAYQGDEQSGAESGGEEPGRGNQTDLG